jgi:hypothetical protein
VTEATVGKFTKAQLFARLEAEGKLEQAQAFFDKIYEQEWSKRRKLRGPKAKYASRVAVIATAKQFPPDPRAEWRVKMAKERERELQVTRDENAKLKAKTQFEDKLRAQREAAKDLRDYHVVEALKDKTDCAVGDLPEPIAWALSHMHEIHDVEDPSKWDIQPQQAPTAAHWNLLMYAVTKTNDFMERAIAEMIAAQKRREERRMALKMAKMRRTDTRQSEGKVDPSRELRPDDGIDKLDALFQETLKSGGGINTHITGTAHFKPS